MKIWSIAGIAVAILAAPCSAQDAPQQTVDGAQEFLRRITTQFDLSDLYVDAGDYLSAHMKIRFEPASRCLSKVTHVYKWRWAGGTSNPGLDNEQNWQGYKDWYAKSSNLTGDALTKAMDTLETYKFPEEIDWASVSSVEVVSTKPWVPQNNVPEDVKRVVFIHGKKNVVMFAPDAAQAARIGYAMEFLRSACDKSAETGF